MRPLPRLHALTDARVLAHEELGRRAAAIAAAGSAVALHARDRTATAAALTAVARRFVALAAPAEAAVIVSGRPDVAAATGAQGVQLAETDLRPADARRVLRHGWIGRSVHSPDEARAAQDEGADYLVYGNVFATATHPGRAAAGLDALAAICAGPLPVIAIGGVTPENVAAVRAAGAWGAAAIRALWDADDPYAAARAMLEPWL